MEHEPITESNNELPVRFPQAMGMRHLFVMMSAILFSTAPSIILLGCFLRYGLHLSDSERVPATQNVAFGSCVCLLVGTLAGKYLWLLAMSRFFSKADVAPMLAYGIPRRIGRFDAALLSRFYKKEDVHEVRKVVLRNDLTKREIKMLRYLVLFFAVFFTSVIPSAYRYPKQNFGDWFIVGIVIFAALGAWIVSVWFWTWTIPILKKANSSGENAI